MTSHSRVYLVNLLSALFAVGSWLCVHGLWVELPLLVQELPEGWTLPSYLSVVICVSNVAPITYSVLNNYFPKFVTEKRGIYLTVLIGVISTCLIASFWKDTSYLWGQERSTTLLCLVFFFGMVDCSSRVLYVPFMSNFHEKYLTSFFIGEGLSALIPSLIALIQGVGGAEECVLVTSMTSNVTSPIGNGTHVQQKYEAVASPPLFSVETFFYIILGVVLLSAAAFHLLNYEVVVRGAVSTAQYDAGYKHESSVRKFERRETDPEKTHGEKLEMSPYKSSNGAVTEKEEPSGGSTTTSESQSSTFLYAVIVQLVVCFVSNGILLSIQPFSSLPYGNSPFHLVVTLTTMINPVICFVFFVLPKPTRFAINTATILVTPLTVYVIATAVMSPHPPFVDSTLGSALVVTAWVVCIGIYVWIKVALATLLRGSEGKRGLFWFGASTQIGSATGGVFSFLLINFTSIFHSYDRCNAMNYESIN